MQNETKCSGSGVEGEVIGQTLKRVGGGRSVYAYGDIICPECCASIALGVGHSVPFDTVPDHARGGK